MADEQTMKDHIEDLLLERAELYERLNTQAIEIEQLRAVYSALFHMTNHAWGFNNFKLIQDNMREHQKAAKELGIYQ